jgi:hypothetical protein
VSLPEAGRRYSHLVVVSEAGKNAHHDRLVACQCDCGTAKTLRLSDLHRGQVTSCGCRRVEAAKAMGLANATHGYARGSQRTPEYRTWRAMLDRCLNQKSTSFPRYGGRGISVCRRWAESFESFLVDVGPRPEGTSLDRINNDGNYESGNVRWASAKEQANNRRRQHAS